MKTSHWATWIGLLATSGSVIGSGPVDGDRRRRVEQLEAEVARLSAGDEWLTGARVAEIRALVSDVLADADTRAALLDDELMAGYDDGFFLAAADGTFRLELAGQVQFRFVRNRRRKGDENDDRYGFENRRTKIKLTGDLGPKMGFTIGTAFSRRTGVLNLQSFNFRFEVTDDLTVLLGRSRPPLLREESVSSKRQLVADRSLVANAFGQSRTLGVTLRYRPGAYRVQAGFMDASPFGSDDDIWRASGRVEVLLKGRWNDLKDFTSLPDDEPALMLGAGVLYQYQDGEDSDEPDAETLRWSVDVSLEQGGWNLFAAVVVNHLDVETAGTFDQYGALVQGGVFLDENWELFARHEWGDADGADAYLSVFTMGVNRYFERHDLKWTFDVGYGLNEVSDFWSTSGAGYLDDRPGENDQVVVRTQLQVLF